MKTRIVAVTALLLLTLTGCAGTPENTPGGTERTSESAKPLVAETPNDEPASDTDAAFVEDVRKALSNGRETTIPDATDEQLLEAGYAACDQLAEGVPDTEVSVVDGEQADDLYGAHPESYIIATVAASRIC